MTVKTQHDHVSQSKVKADKQKPSLAARASDKSGVVGFSLGAQTYSCAIPGMSDRVIRPARTLLSCRPLDTIGCPVCGVEFQVSKDP